MPSTSATALIAAQFDAGRPGAALRARMITHGGRAALIAATGEHFADGRVVAPAGGRSSWFASRCLSVLEPLRGWSPS